MAQLVSQAFALAEQSPDPVAFVSVSGGTYVYYLRGEIDRAIAGLDRAIELTGGDPRVAADTTVANPLAYVLTFKGGFRALQGRVAEGRALLEEGIEMALEYEDFETAGWGWQWKTWVDYFTCDAEAASIDARRAHELAERVGHNFSRTWSLTMLGAVELIDGNWERAKEGARARPGDGGPTSDGGRGERPAQHLAGRSPARDGRYRDGDPACQSRASTTANGGRCPPTRRSAGWRWRGSGWRHRAPWTPRACADTSAAPSRWSSAPGGI